MLLLNLKKGLSWLLWVFVSFIVLSPYHIWIGIKNVEIDDVEVTCILQNLEHGNRKSNMILFFDIQTNID